MRLFRNKQGQKMYPVCSWEANQHKIYNAYDRIENALFEQGYPDDLLEEREKILQAIAIIDGYQYNGIVYATYEEGQLVKNYIHAYDLRRDLKVRH